METYGRRKSILSVGSYLFERDSFFLDYDRLVRTIIRRGAPPEVTEVAFSPKRHADIGFRVDSRSRA